MTALLAATIIASPTQKARQLGCHYIAFSADPSPPIHDLRQKPAPKIVQEFSNCGSWVKQLDNYVVTDGFAKLAARTPFADSRGNRWSRAKGEWVGRAGWTIIALMALNDPDRPDEDFVDLLDVIRREIHARKNRVRDAMNMALIAIGRRNVALRVHALGAAREIGKVVVDHGETGCKTPDAAEYIQRPHPRSAKARQSSLQR